MRILQKDKKLFYFNTKERFASLEFGNTLYQLLHEHKTKHQPLIFLCIGSDRATGDCLGPLLGHKLSSSPYTSSYYVYGTLQEPVHAKNLSETLAHIYQTHADPFIIAIDASLGKTNHIGYYTVGEGALRPGAGVAKELPSVGDLFITGIVNISGLLDQMLLQTTRLQVVVALTEQIYSGINHCLRQQATHEYVSKAALTSPRKAF